MEKILFLVHTEYHLLISTKIILDLYNIGQYEIHVLLSKTPAKSRLKDSYNFSDFKNVIVTNVFYDEFDRKPNENLKEIVSQILNAGFNRFYFFQEHHPLNVYLAYKFQKSGTIVCLGPDGAKAYTRIKRIAPRWSLLAFIWYHRFLFANGFYFWKMPRPNLKYASFDFIDEVWLPYIEKYLNWNHKKLIKINNEFNKEVLYLIKRIFSFTGEELLERENIIFFVNQNFGDQRLDNFEVEFLTELKKLHPYKKIFIKMHPNTTESHIKRLSEVPNIQILADNVPAELYILNLTNSMIVSFWSTSNLTFNPSCRYYWAYPMIIERGIMIKHFHLSDPTDYIIHVNKIEEIQ